MKKVLFAVMAFAAIGFTSCGNKAQQTAAEDVEAVADSTEIDVDAAVEEATAQLTEQIDAQDANKLQEVLTAVQDQVKEAVAFGMESRPMAVEDMETRLFA